jgi:hypothetical protein
MYAFHCFMYDIFLCKSRICIIPFTTMCASFQVRLSVRDIEGISQMSLYSTFFTYMWYWSTHSGYYIHTVHRDRKPYASGYLDALARVFRGRENFIIVIIISCLFVDLKTRSDFHSMTESLPSSFEEVYMFGLCSGVILMSLGVNNGDIFEENYYQLGIFMRQCAETMFWDMIEEHQVQSYS